MMRGVVPVLWMLGPLAALAVACGGGETPPPETANDVERPRSRGDRPTISASAEIGALDEAKVSSAFRGALPALQQCLARGAARNEMLGGEIAFFLKVGSDGRLVHAHAERSTIGDRETEVCMFGVLRKRDWPPPQGGDVGLARNSFSFDMPNDTRPPTDWSGDRVEGAVRDVSSELSSCKRGVRGDVTATVYVDPDGAAMSAGVAFGDESGEQAADCIVKVLKGAKYPSPGSWPAKVTFSL